jgi:hypothetical protein
MKVFTMIIPNIANSGTIGKIGTLHGVLHFMDTSILMMGINMMIFLWKRFFKNDFG